MSYVDGFVIPIKKKNLAKYKKMATMGKKIWMKHGALDYYECAGDDIEQKWGGFPFKKAYKMKSDETVIFAFIVYKSKSHRNQVNKKVMADPMMNPDKFDPVFDMKRMTVGGFKTLVQA